MSKYMQNKKADEFGVSHATAALIYESCETVDEFLSALEAYANGEGFTLVD